MWPNNIIEGMREVMRNWDGLDPYTRNDVLNDPRKDAEPTDWLSTDHSMEMHKPFACPVCGGSVIWFDGDGYRCRECDQPCNPDGTPYEEVAK